jgi:hypothetical protein
MIHTIVSCGNHKEGGNSSSLRVTPADVARFAGDYTGIVSTCGDKPEGIFHILTDKDSTSIYVPDCAFGSDSCEQMENIYGEVRDGMVVFPKKSYADKCGKSYTYDATVTFVKDTMIYAFNFAEINGEPWHCEVKMLRK